MTDFRPLLKRLGLALIVLLVVASALPAAAQQKASAGAAGTTGITGTVKDVSGGALPGVTVTALNLSSGREITAITDVKGQYTFTNVIPSTYRVSAKLSGFSESGKSVNVTRGETSTADFALGLGGLSEEITVTAAKGERATAEVNQVVTVISSKDIEDRRPGGVEEAFERAPNVRQVDTNPYRARPQFRGFSNSRILLVVDGERLNNGRYDVANSGVTPSTIDVTQIQSIEVVGGAASSLYGSDAIAGTINIITKTADRPASGKTLDVHTTVDFNGNSSFTRGNMGVTFATPKFALRGAVSGFNQPDYKAGGDAISKDEVVRLGQFISTGGALVGRAVASTYAVYDLAGGARVPNGGAKGYTTNFDASYFPSEKHMFRVRYMQNRFDNLGLPFSTPPYDTFLRLSTFADFDKISGRYEARELFPWLPRFTVSGYHQKMARPQNDISYTIASGSSYTGNTLTGNLSTFSLASKTETINDITSDGFDVQANIQPIRIFQWTTGVAYSKDLSVDTFNRSSYSATGAVLTQVTGAKTTPDTDYKNLGWYNQFELTPVKYVKLSGGFRVDNWKTQGNATKGFPAGNEFGTIQIAMPQILANPGSLVVAGIQGIDGLVAGTGKLSTNITTTTGNAGIMFLLPGGINPYLRYATSFREPEITVRYLVRNFGPPTLSIPSLPNTTIKPETGKNIDTGVKIERERIRLQLGYFRNTLTNAVSTVYSPNYCVTADPAAGRLATPFPPCLFTGSHAVQFFQRVNVPGDVIVKGFEAAGEASLALGSFGSLNPYVSLGWQKGTQTIANATQTTLMNAYYNQAGTPVKLEGSVSDTPYGEIPGLTGTVALKYTDAKAKFWAEYEVRFASKITRVDPDAIFSVNFPLYGGLKSLEGYSKHTVRAGYDFTGKLPLKLTLGLENITNKTYFLPFQNGPSPGFSLILGATFNFKMKFD
jgi:outer membrane receptor protein involved in Fe transport